MEIGQYDVEFVPRQTIKSQVLTDFIAEWMNSGYEASVICPIIG
jgi:hypothetical protein